MTSRKAERPVGARWSQLTVVIGAIVVSLALGSVSAADESSTGGEEADVYLELG